MRLCGGTITSDGEYVGSVYNFINLACNKRGKYAYKKWERLTSENSEYKDELKKLVTLEYVKGLSGQIDDLSGLSGQIDDLSHTKETRRRETNVMTLRGLQRLMMSDSLNSKILSLRNIKKIRSLDLQNGDLSNTKKNVKSAFVGISNPIARCPTWC